MNIFLASPIPLILYQLMMSTLSSISYGIIEIYHTFDVRQEKSKYPEEIFLSSTTSTFDFIIVGAGTSGSVIAHHLSPPKYDFSVLLLEAGGDPIPLTKIPALFTAVHSSPRMNYAYKTVPQTDTCLGLNSRQSYWPQGKGLGGTSNINALIWTKGHDKDYDNWANITGDSRWNSTNLLKYFKNTETKVTKAESELGKKLIEAAMELGYPHVNTNEPYKEAGFDHFNFNTDNGIRNGAYEAYLQPARCNHPKLTIHKYAVATKILIDKETRRAYGVEYEHLGQKRVSLSTKEIILSAGAIESPKLLMLFGIGPKEELEKHKIPLIADLPVGQNLQDHLVAPFGPHTIEQPLSFHPQLDINLQTLLDFTSTNRSGLLSSTLYSAGGYITSTISKQAGEHNWPDLQFVLQGASVSDEYVAGIAEERCNTKPGLLAKYFNSSYGRYKYSFILAPVLVRPKARGWIKLQGKDPNLPLLINPNYLQHPDDLKVIIEGLQIATKMLQNTQSFQSIETKINPNSFPGCEDRQYLSYEYFKCFVRSFTLAGSHASGTCAMGNSIGVGDSSRPPNSVVDSELKVITINGLRIADASVIPVIPNANIYWPCLMIGERAAQMILSDWI